MKSLKREKRVEERGGKDKYNQRMRGGEGERTEQISAARQLGGERITGTLPHVTHIPTKP